MATASRPHLATPIDYRTQPGHDSIRGIRVSVLYRMPRLYRNAGLVTFVQHVKASTRDGYLAGTGLHHKRPVGIMGNVEHALAAPSSTIRCCPS